MGSETLGPSQFHSPTLPYNVTFAGFRRQTGTRSAESCPGLVIPDLFARLPMGCFTDIGAIITRAQTPGDPPRQKHPIWQILTIEKSHLFY
ncbi:MAG: hypothetical protein ACI8R4_003931 [Paracoccaceae bacterium]|jgi:hypothetical protein